MTRFPAELQPLITMAVARIREIADSLLARHRAGSKRPVRVDLFALINTLLVEKRLQHRERRVELEFVGVAPGVGLPDKIDPADLQRILSNLIDNAIEAFEHELEGIKRITVTVEAKDRQLTLKVTDNGKVISAEILPRLAERGATFGKTEGSGLGLYYARTTVEKWGGRLVIQSIVGAGTVVSIILPT